VHTGLELQDDSGDKNRRATIELSADVRDFVNPVPCVASLARRRLKSWRFYCTFFCIRSFLQEGRYIGEHSYGKINTTIGQNRKSLWGKHALYWLWARWFCQLHLVRIMSAFFLMNRHKKMAGYL
jgi:hypothetical protein